MIKILKDPDILQRKPKLRLMPNHYSFASEHGRHWNPQLKGQAIRDEKGWYKKK